MVIKNIFILSLFLLVQCNVTESKKGVEISISGIYDKTKLLSDEPAFSVDSLLDNSNSFALLRLRNLSDNYLFLPCLKSERSHLYNPSKIEQFIINDTTEHFTLIDCYNCNQFVSLMPNDSTSIYSILYNFVDCANMKGDSVVFYYPYVLDTTNILVNFFVIDVKINKCQIKPNFARVFKVNDLRSH